MKKTAYILSVALLVASASSTAFAQQNLRTAYFLDGYTYNYKMNPSFAPERGFFAMPALGNLGLGVESKMGLSTFLYPTADGNMTTFLNSSVSSDEFLKKLRKNNGLNITLNETLLAAGFRTGKSFHTIDLSLKADVGASLPKDLFSFMKNGGAGGTDTWDISRIGVRANARMELAYGYSRPILDWIRVGARAKLIMGAARADALIDNMNLRMNGQEWAVKAHGRAQISAPVTFGTKSGSKEIDFDNIQMPEDMKGWTEYLSSPSLGFALDLGASFDFLEYFTASVSVLDLGFVGWNGTTTAVMPGGEWSFDGFGTIGTDSGNNVEDQLSDMGDQLLDMLKMEKTADNVKKSNMLAATLHAGIEARMPFYERLAFGCLFTQRIDGIYSWTEGRLSANVAPVRWFSAAASYAISSFGSSLGGVLNIHLPGFNLYAGLDSFLPLMNVTPQFVPIDSLNTNLTLGLTFTFGKPAGRYWE